MKNPQLSLPQSKLSLWLKIILIALIFLTGCFKKEENTTNSNITNTNFTSSATELSEKTPQKKKVKLVLLFPEAIKKLRSPSTFTVRVYVSGPEIVKPILYTFSEVSEGNCTFYFDIPYGKERFVEATVHQIKGIEYPLYFGSTIVDVDDTTDTIEISLRKSFYTTTEGKASYPEHRVYHLLANNMEESKKFPPDFFIIYQGQALMSELWEGAFYELFKNEYPVTETNKIPVKDLWHYFGYFYDDFNETALFFFNPFSEPEENYAIYFPEKDELLTLRFEEFCKASDLPLLYGPFGRKNPGEFIALEKGESEGTYLFKALDLNGTLYTFTITRTDEDWKISTPAVNSNTKTITLTGVHQGWDQPYYLLRESKGYIIPYLLYLNGTKEKENATLTFKVNTNFSTLLVPQWEDNFTTTSDGIDLASFNTYMIEKDLSNLGDNATFSITRNSSTFTITGNNLYFASLKVPFDKKTIFSKLDEHLGGIGYPEYVKNLWLSDEKEDFIFELDKAKSFLFITKGPVSEITGGFYYTGSLSSDEPVEVGVLKAGGVVFKKRLTAGELTSITLPDITLEISTTQLPDERVRIKVSPEGTDISQLAY